MERLTERHSGIAVIRDKNRHREAMEVLAKYEETGLTSEQVKELKEKNIPKKPIKHVAKFAPIYECPVCGNIDVYGQLFCDECGQRLDWSK